MNRSIASLALTLLLFGANAAIALAQQSIINSPHNLSASGPGAIHAASEQQVCIFCHTPHNAAPVQPLWNRSVPSGAYKVYSSKSMQATPGQPTGASKLCLSCHDGTIALGSVLSRSQPIAMAGGITTLPPGKSNLGTDLSDDHPVSFVYDAALAGKDSKLLSPTQLPPHVRLDSNGEMQCSTCHDAHNNQFGKFLVSDNSSSQLCRNCHNPGTTSLTNHVQCASCHQPHTAPSGPYLLKAPTVTDTCVSCHNSTPSPTQGIDIASNLTKLSRHDTKPVINLPTHIPNNVNCKDCHEPHTMQTGTVPPEIVSPKLGRIDGISITGATLPLAQYSYEVCFKCHADQHASNVTLPPRQIMQANVRLQFSTSAVSYHPVAAAGRNFNVPSLKAPYNTGSIIACTDCHASENSKAAGGTGANGPHGSDFKPGLIAQYLTADYTTENSSSYALCYRCHNRDSFLLESGPFKYHKLHVVEQRTPCALCHDAHGISGTQGTLTGNSRLINFNTSVVQPAGPTTPILFDSVNKSCTLMCHGKIHSASMRY